MTSYTDRLPRIVAAFIVGFVTVLGKVSNFMSLPELRVHNDNWNDRLWERHEALFEAYLECGATRAQWASQWSESGRPSLVSDWKYLCFRTSGRTVGFGLAVVNNIEFHLSGQFGKTAYNATADALGR